MAEHAQHHDLAGHHSADDQYLETPPGSSYEHTDASVGVLVKFAFWLIVSAVIVHVGLGLMYELMIRQSVEGVDTRQYPMAVDQAQRLPPAPRLQQSPGNEIYDFRLKEAEELRSYGWVDKDAGTVRIPIEDAMRLILERGLPSRDPNTSAPAGPAGMMPSDASSGRVLERRMVMLKARCSIRECSACAGRRLRGLVWAVGIGALGIELRRTRRRRSERGRDFRDPATT
jgi:hypothetical protein